MLRITGLVRIANSARKALAEPIAPQRLEQVRAMVQRSIASVGEMLTRHGTTIASLPAPTRRAYEFLKSIDFTRVRVADVGAAHAEPSVKLSFDGLIRHFEGILHRLDIATGEADLPPIQLAIERMSREIEGSIRRREGRRVELSEQTSQIRGWVAYFCELDHLRHYTVALNSARPVLLPAAAAHWPGRALHLSFRPADVIYRLKDHRTSCELILPTPMIVFSPDDFARLARLLGRKDGIARQHVVKAMEDAPFQALQAQLARLAGAPALAAGFHHDLIASFDRVNIAHFRGLMPRPKLQWSQVMTSRKFGHYDSINDTVMLSSTLDRPDVPAFVVDFIMFHELLHKEMGVDRTNGRAYAHTPEFRRAERQFPRFIEAEQFLHKLAMSC